MEGSNSSAHHSKLDETMLKQQLEPRTTPIESPLLTSAERELVLHQFNNTDVAYPHDGLIHELFEAQVQRTPDAIAVICGDRQLTYAQLNRRANQVAHALLARGVRSDERVGLYAERSVEMVIGMLAILKAGGAYVPMDPTYPAERLTFMRDDSSVTGVLTTASLLGQVANLERPAILLDEDFPQPGVNVEVSGLTSRNLAYVIYTSGSTGRPKGVMIEHRSVLRLVIHSSYAPIGPDDCVAHCASPSFDATTWEIWSALLNGARLLIVSQPVVLDPVALNQQLIQHAVTAMWLTVGLFNNYVDALEQAFSGLHYLLIGGDALVPAMVARALAKAVPPQHLINGYGPTETTTFATTYPITAVPDGAQSLPIGRPIANTRIYILGDNREPVPVGVAGEIYIGGPGVARGYLNQPALTAERFVADPFSDVRDAKLYRTGDSGRWRADGNIEYLGRNDRQVKIRGFRAEPGEVEAALQGYPGVKQAVVIAREDHPGDKRLVGYVVEDLPRREHSDDADAIVVIPSLALRLRKYLKERIPPYMVPAAIVVLREFPLTPNGKVDRRALPAPEGCRQLQQAYVAARTPTEEMLCEIWGQLLNLEQVGVQDDFFELGGDSLLGLTLITNVEASINIQFPFVAIFQYPTIEKMAQLVEQLLSDNVAPPASDKVKC